MSTKPSKAEQKKRKAIKEYYTDMGSIAPWVKIGAGLLMLGFVGVSMLALVVVAFFVVWGIYDLIRRGKLLNEKQIDQWRQEDYNAHDYVKSALSLCGGAETVREPVVLLGAASKALSGGVFEQGKLGKDGRYRSTPASATTLMCTADQLLVYQTGIDLTTGNRVNERFLEVFYQDIVAIRISSQTNSNDLSIQDEFVSRLPAFQFGSSRPTKSTLKSNLQALRTKFSDYLIDDVLQMERTRSYEIDLSDGQTIAVAVYDGRPTIEANAAENQAFIDESAKSMYALRAFVRDKKRALLNSEIMANTL